MEKKSFGTLSLTRLSNDDFSNLIEFSIDVATPSQSALGDVGKAALTNLETKARPFIIQTNKLRANRLSETINGLGKQQLELVAEMKRIIVFEKKSRDSGCKISATDAEPFFKPYWDIPTLVFSSQITHTTELVTKYDAAPDIQAKCAVIGVNVVMAELRNCNATLRALYLQRNEEVGGSISGTDLRPAAYDAYVRFCTVVEQTLNLMPNDMLLTVFNNMDELRAKAHALIAKDKPEETDTTKE